MLNLLQASRADQETTEEFQKYLLSVTKEKGYVEEQVFNAADTGVFYKDIGKQTYIMQMASKLLGFKSL